MEETSIFRKINISPASKILDSLKEKYSGVQTVFHGGQYEIVNPDYSRVLDGIDKFKNYETWCTSCLDTGKLTELIPEYKTLDFGPGFYLDFDFKTTKEWAVASDQVMGRFSGIVNEYTIDLSDEELKVYYMDICNTQAYVGCLLKYRSTSESIDALKLRQLVIQEMFPKDIVDYDVVVGPRLDSRYARVMEMLVNGDIGLDVFEYAMSQGEYNYQISIHTSKAFKKLKHIETHGVVDVELGMKSIRNRVKLLEDLNEKIYQTKETRYLKDILS